MSFGGFKGMVENSMLDLHTGYIGRVVAFDGATAKVQPLAMQKEINQAPKRLPIIADVPVVNSARFKFSVREFQCEIGAGTETRQHIVGEPLAPGDLVYCVCADRDISGALRGDFYTPTIRRHSLSDSVVVGVL